MLKSIDIFIGLSVVMLVVSMAVTLVTQFFLSVSASRGRHLFKGLTDMLEQLHPGATRTEAEALAKLVLTNPAVASVGVGPWKLGELVHREELTKFLLEFGAGHVKPDLTAVEQTALAKLKAAMNDSGIADPGKTLDNARMMALQLEKAAPELAANVRHSMALLQEAPSQYLAKINLWFDGTMDRVSGRFTTDARLWTFVSAAIIALALQLDTVTMVNRFAMDDKLRDSFVQVAVEAEQKGNPAVANNDAMRSQFEFLEKAGVVSAPASYSAWQDQWKHTNIWGVVISTLLLSLGAPFWYSMLGKLLQLRSLIAQKDDAQRTERQTSQPGALASAAVPAALAAGERGDLTAIG